MDILEANQLADLEKFTGNTTCEICEESLATNKCTWKGISIYLCNECLGVNLDEM